VNVNFTCGRITRCAKMKFDVRMSNISTFVRRVVCANVNFKFIRTTECVHVERDVRMWKLMCVH